MLKTYELNYKTSIALSSCDIKQEVCKHLLLLWQKLLHEMKWQTNCSTVLTATRVCDIVANIYLNKNEWLIKEEMTSVVSGCIITTHMKVHTHFKVCTWRKQFINISIRQNNEESLNVSHLYVHLMLYSIAIMWKFDTCSWWGWSYYMHLNIHVDVHQIVRHV